MSKSIIAIGIGILITGLIAGMLFGVGIDTGLPLDEGSISLMVMKTFCQAIEEINSTMVFNCWGYLAILAVLSIFVGVAEIYVTAEKIGDWKIGLGVYGIGWIIGLIWILVG